MRGAVIGGDPLPYVDPWGERQAHPCDCTTDTCQNPEEHSGATEYDPREIAHDADGGAVYTDETGDIWNAGDDHECGAL